MHEMKYLGPMFLHQMYPSERFMTILKMYVPNQSCPEGCMSQGWATEEVIEFAIDYMDLNAIGKPVPRHEGRLSGKGTRGHTTFNVNDYVSYTQAHFTVLQQSIVVAPYIKMHVQLLRSMNPKKSEDYIAWEHRDNFGTWLRIQMMNKGQDVAPNDKKPDDI